MFKKGVYIGGMHGIQCKTLIRFLRKIAARDGMNRTELYPLHTTQTAEFWDAIRDTKYPKGLYGLVSEERCRRDEFATGKHPRKWFITQAGRVFLAAVSTNPAAMPPENIKRERKFVSDDAKELAKEERYRAARYQRNLETYQRRCARPKHAKGAHDLPPKNVDIDPSSPEFKGLPSLERVRILRARKAKESESFFISEPATDWTPEEWAVVQAQLNPKKVKPAAAKNVPEPQPSLPAPAVKPPAPAPFKLEPKPLTPEQEADHDRRVSEFVKRLRDLQKEPK